MAVESPKKRVLIVGSGGVGTMAAYALETGGRAHVTCVLRSNYAAVVQNGFSIDSIDHGKGITGWKPSELVNQIPTAGPEATPFDFILVTTKNVPDVRPTVEELVAPAVTSGHTAIVLLQNGLNIERSIVKRFPQNVVLSGVSFIGATETAHGKIRHDDNDFVKLGAFPSCPVAADVSRAVAEDIVEVYNACGKVDWQIDSDVLFTRWRKLVYNACYNSTATILRLDTTRMRIWEHPVDDLVRPLMQEIKSVAAAAGVKLPDDIVDTMTRIDPVDSYFKPSMCQDIEKGNYIEYENIVGEPLREAQRLGVDTPHLKITYGILKALQRKTMEAKGLISPSLDSGSRYI